MKHRVFWARFFLVAALVTAALIFWFSAQKGEKSQLMSDGITLRVAHLLKPDFKEMTESARLSYLEQLSYIIRKNAHFCEFMLLGFCLMGWQRFGFPERRWALCGLWAWGIATLYAGTDELHQLFINERSAQLTDVCIDSAGSLTGVLIAALVLALALRRIGRQNFVQ